jgi:hypothetical protein
MRQPAATKNAAATENANTRLIDRRPYLLPLAMLALALALGLLFAPPLPAKEAPRPATATPPAPTAQADTRATAQTPTEADTADLKDRLRTLEDRERQTYAFVLEGQRKTMDWWFSYLAVVTAIIGLGGVFLPYLLAKKEKEDLRQMQESFREQLGAARAMADEIRGHHERAKEAADAIVTQRELLTDALLTPMGTPEQQSAQKAELQSATKAIEANPVADVIDRLRAKAIRFTMDKDYVRAKAIWQSLTELNPQDAQAQFALGLCSHLEADALKDTQPETARTLWQQATDHYRQALVLRPDKYVVAYKWGSALAAEASALAPTNLPAARNLWRQAAERFRQTLDLKPDMYEAAVNWSMALLDEFRELRPTDPKAAQGLLDEAATHLHHAESIKPGSFAYELAYVFALRGDIKVCINWLNTARQHGTLKSAADMRDDEDFDAVRQTPEFTTWWREVFGPDEPLVT